MMNISNLKSKHNNVSIQIKEVCNKTTKDNSNFMSKYKELIKKREEKIKCYKNKDSENKQHISISNTTNVSIEFSDIKKDIKLHNTDTSPSNHNKVSLYTLLPEDTLREDNETHIDINDKITQNEIHKFNFKNINIIENSNLNNLDISKSYIDYYSEKSLNTHLIKENIQFKIKTNSNVNRDSSEISNTSSFTNSLKNNSDVSKFKDFNKNENLNTLQCTSSKGII